MLLCPSIKTNVPATESGDNFFLRDGFLFSKDVWISFQKDVRIFFGFFFRISGSGFSFGLWTFGWFNTGIRFGFSDVGPGFSFGLWTWLFKGTMDLVLLSDFWTWFFFRTLDLVFQRDDGPGFSFGFLDLVFLLDVGYFKLVCLTT
jgi:hypothetical protein